MFDMRRIPAFSESKRLRACFLLCMLCTLCTHIHLMVGMETYEKIWLFTSNVQIAASLAFLVLAVRRPLSPMGRWHLAFGLALAIVDKWLTTPFSGEARHQRRIDKMMALEQE